MISPSRSVWMTRTSSSLRPNSCFHQLLAHFVGKDVLLGHDEQNRPMSNFLYTLPVFLPVANRGNQPVAVLLGRRFLAVTFSGSLRSSAVTISGAFTMRSSTACAERIIADDPRIVDTILVLGRSREVEPS